MKVILVHNYCNFSDRIVKFIKTSYTYQDVIDYLAENLYYYDVINDVNIDTRDGIDTEFIINWQYNYTPNFCYVFGTETSETAMGTGWFVMEFEKTRGYQYRIRIHRDVVGDHYDSIINSPCYIQRAMLDNINDLIFNSEGMQFNQIKQSEDLLKDKLGAYYYVAYIDKNPEWSGQGQSQGKITGDANSSFSYITFSTASDAYPFVKGIAKSSPETSRRFYANKYEIVFDVGQRLSDRARFKIILDNTHIISVSTRNDTPVYGMDNVVIGTKLKSSQFNEYCAKVKELINFNTLYTYVMSAVKANIRNDYVDKTLFNKLSDVNGQIVHDNWEYEGSTADEYFTYDTTSASEGSSAFRNDGTSNASNLALYVQNVAYDAAQAITGEGSKYNSTINIGYRTTDVYSYKFIRTPYQSTSQFEFQIPTVRQHCADAPYDILVIPVGCKYAGSGGTISPLNNNLQIQFAEALNRIGTSEGWLKDMQRLPYSPIVNEEYIIMPPGQTDYVVDVTYTATPAKLKLENNILCCFASSKQLSFSINKSITVDNLKISNEVDSYRLVSPNNSSIFEFSVAKNGGAVNYFNVDCTFRPMSPYIHINPDFNRLYSQDFNDYRGLILGGDYSVATMTDAWLQYASQNKMYQNTFDRQIQNLEFNQKYQRIEQGINAVGGAIGTGLTAGLLTGNVGIGIGTGVTSGIAGAGDLAILQQQQQEAKDYLKDAYNLNLRNIQAQPDTLLKTGSDDYNNKIWPYLEYYTCSAYERYAFEQYIKYKSMTVGYTGYIKDYLQSEPSFIQGILIRLEISEDNHMITKIKDEIAKGVYI